MVTYLERYQQGEYAQVWSELGILGSRIREPDLFEDAVAVAHTTMSRVATNVATLFHHLQSAGYQFLRPAQAFCSPAPAIQQRLAAFEAQIGVLPLSLRAWYEEVGSVDFTRSPIHAPQLGAALKQQGFRQVLVFTDAHHLIDTYRATRADLVIWHLTLPADPEFERIALLLAWIQPGCHLAMVLVTPDDTLAIRRQAAQLGIAYVFAEYPPPEELGHILRLVLSNHYGDNPWLIYYLRTQDGADFTITVDQYPRALHPTAHPIYGWKHSDAEVDLAPGSAIFFREATGFLVLVSHLDPVSAERTLTEVCSNLEAATGQAVQITPGTDLRAIAEAWERLKELDVALERIR